MTYTEAVQKTVVALCQLAPIDQVDFVKECWRRYENKEVFIFPMAELKDFCWKYQGEHSVFLDVEKLKGYKFDTEHTWCMYNPKANCFMSANEPRYFVYFSIEELMKSVLSLPDLMESKMGFSKKEIADMQAVVK